MNKPVDMSAFIQSKSDQINADDLIGGPRTITITGVSANESSPEQPINIRFEDDDGKPFRPCKSMRRVMVAVWGADASKYVGRSMTLYRDPKVQFGGMQVGGIRISHMSHIDEKKTMALTATRAKRAPYTVEPLRVEQQRDKAAEWADEQLAAIEQCADVDALDALSTKGAKAMGKLQGDRPELHAKVTAAYEAKRAWFGLADSAGDHPFGYDDTPPADHSGYIAGITRRIERSTTDAELDEIAADLKSPPEGMPDDELAALDVALAKRRREVARSSQ